MEKIFVLGITGKMGSGKSTLSKQIHSEFAGSVLIDCDSLFKETVKNDNMYQRALRIIAQNSNVQNLYEHEELNPIVLVDMMYHNMKAAASVNRVVSAFMFNEVSRIIRDSKGLVIIESAYMLNSPIADICNLIVNIDVNKDIRWDRVAVRDKGRNPSMTHKLFAINDIMANSPFTPLNVYKCDSSESDTKLVMDFIRDIVKEM